MIRYLDGDIFTGPAQTIVNTVNTVGVMGKGIALEFKKRYPAMFESYKLACEKKRLKTGRLMLFYEADHWVLNFPTKEHWRSPSRLEYIEQGLIRFTKIYAEYGITSIAFPKLGCGNGELDWKDVKPLMEKYLKDLPIDIYIYTGVIKDVIPEHKNQTDIVNWLRQNAKDLSFNGLCDDIRYNCSIVPYSFDYDGSNISIIWNNGIVFSQNGKEDQFLSEDDLFECWDYIRNKGIVKSDEKVLWNYFYGLMFALGYLSKVVINDDDMQVNGYQLNSGLGRSYSLEGITNVQCNNKKEF